MQPPATARLVFESRYLVNYGGVLGVARPRADAALRGPERWTAPRDATKVTRLAYLQLASGALTIVVKYVATASNYKTRLKNAQKRKSG